MCFFKEIERFRELGRNILGETEIESEFGKKRKSVYEPVPTVDKFTAGPLGYRSGEQLCPVLYVVLCTDNGLSYCC